MVVLGLFPALMRTRQLILISLTLVYLLVAAQRVAAQTQFSETWEPYTSGVTPYGDWQLGSGSGFSWGSISTPGLDGSGKRYSVAAGQKSRILRPIDLDSHTHVVLQGWLYDSNGGANRSVLGLGSSPTATDLTLIRFGAGGGATYTIQHYEGGSLNTVDTALPVEAGWHFLRLDIVYDGNPGNLWTVTWRLWNAGRTVEKMGVFGWHFDRVNCNYVILGAAAATPAAMAWDDIKVGSTADVGPPPSLPLGPWQVNLTVMASSEIPGWPATSAVDGNAGTVWSSTSHGANPDAIEWLMLDYGQVIPMTGASISPRPGGGCWPVDYRIEITTDWVTWSTVPGMDFTGQTPPAGTVSLTFSNAIAARGLRLYATKLSSDGANCYLQIAEFKALGVEPWASPAELRGKKVIGSGQYTAIDPGDPDAPTPKFLANNPDYLANHPFDGISLQVPVDLAWCTNQGLISQSAYGLNQLTMTRLAIPYSAVQAAVADLQRVSWGHLTDNFLWYGLWDASQWGDDDTRYPVDPASASDWTNVTRNAALCARICREAKLKGFTMDTEQYSNYGSGEPYPFGKGTPEVWRQRGQQWIQAVQAEFPAIKIILFFSWGPEAEGAWPGYENLKYFMNGILAGVQSPARLIHGWESTFWYGGSLAENGIITPLHSGDRAAYAQTRNDIRNVWRNYSDNPAKYDQFVDVGMAAWVESDPYNLTPGWPTGFLSRPPWSNLPLTLAYSDSYVWVWSERTSYPRTKEILNPFLASIANQTFNTGQETAKSFTETFQTDPLRRGWHFDFDMLGIGREVNPGFLPAMNPDAIAYNWDPTNQAVRVRSAWTTGLYGERTGAFAWQRRRYVHPLQALTRTNTFHAEFDFQVENFGADPANPILLGLFNTSSLVTTQSITLRLDGPTTAAVTVAGDGLPWASALSLSHALTTTRTYRISFSYNGTTASLQTFLTDTSDSSVVGQVSGTVPATAGQFQLDEAGIAQWDATFTSTAPAQSHQYLLKRAALFPSAPVLSLASAHPLGTNGFQFALQGLPGQTYQIETSTNLANWSVIGSILATNTPVLFLDPAATNHARRFYRARE